MHVPNILVFDLISVLICVTSISLFNCGLGDTLQSASALSSTILSVSSIDRSHLRAISPDACLVNASSPPHFNADHIADSHANSFSSVRVKSFVYKLV